MTYQYGGSSKNCIRGTNPDGYLITTLKDVINAGFATLTLPIKAKAGSDADKINDRIKTMLEKKIVIPFLQEIKVALDKEIKDRYYLSPAEGITEDWDNIDQFIPKATLVRIITRQLDFNKPIDDVDAKWNEYRAKVAIAAAKVATIPSILFLFFNVINNLQYINQIFNKTTLEYARLLFINQLSNSMKKPTIIQADYPFMKWLEITSENKGKIKDDTWPELVKILEGELLANWDAEQIIEFADEKDATGILHKFTLGSMELSAQTIKLIQDFVKIPTEDEASKNTTKRKERDYGLPLSELLPDTTFTTITELFNKAKARYEGSFSDDKITAILKDITLLDGEDGAAHPLVIGTDILPTESVDVTPEEEVIVLVIEESHTPSSDEGGGGNFNPRIIDKLGGNTFNPKIINMLQKAGYSFNPKLINIK